jgi:hypothetical protein
LPAYVAVHRADAPKRMPTLYYLKIKKMVKKLEPKTKEKTIVDICNTLQNFAQNSFY